MTTQLLERPRTRTVRLAREDDFDGWREAARALAVMHVPPEEIAWEVDNETDSGQPAAPPAAAGLFSISRAFVELARDVICHTDPERLSLLYALLCRLRLNPKAMDDSADPLVRRLERMAMAVRRDMHRMRTYLRFHERRDGEGRHYVAWYEPEHRILRASSGYFVRRFANLRWTIQSPDLSLHWDGEILTEAPGVIEPAALDDGPAQLSFDRFQPAFFSGSPFRDSAMRADA